MNIKNNSQDKKILINFKGGEKYLEASIYDDGLNKILTNARLIPGASIGLHTHEDSSEIIYIISGSGLIICDGEEEIINSGDVHYCKKGSSHTFINNGNEDIIFFAVVPKQ